MRLSPSTLLVLVAASVTGTIAHPATDEQLTAAIPVLPEGFFAGYNKPDGTSTLQLIDTAQKFTFKSCMDERTSFRRLVKASRGASGICLFVRLLPAGLNSDLVIFSVDVLAATPTLICEDNIVQQRTFAGFVKVAYYGYLDGDRPGQGRLENSPKIFKLMHLRHTGVTLSDAIAWTSKSLATGARDRIYASLASSNGTSISK
ncbi:hypothetical protein DE146DRAFT_635128 [Phaeosphaeria sp. MPI-PUGE-AT-0046c]|nr:hypothetical protein DE146DRAFT_635128 [Phaeosphaeria sp. MPI-PUGE-AT-0046c]